jgi:hypothetical protein
MNDPKTTTKTATRTPTELKRLRALRVKSGIKAGPTRRSGLN